MNCYKVFAELREALAGGRALDEAKDFNRDFKRSEPRSPLKASPRVQFLFEASDFPN